MVLIEGSIKATKNMLGYIKIKNICVSKDTINRVKRQLVGWKKIFANHVKIRG